MKTEEKKFFSDGIELAGGFYWADEPRPNAPLIIPCSGFTGLRHIHPERFARSLCRAGYNCFAFDYRGFAPSSGTPGAVFLEEQVRDIRYAAAFAASEMAGETPIVLLGWGMAAGLVLQAASGLPDVAGLVCVNGFYNSERTQRAVRGQAGWNEFEHWLVGERKAIARAPEPRWVDPFLVYPLDPQSKTYVDDVLRAAPGYEGDRYHSTFADSLRCWDPEKNLAHLGQIPALIIHGDQNQLHPTAEAEALHRSYPGPKKLFWLEGAGHTEFMDDANPLYQALAGEIVTWLNQIHG